MLKLTSKGSLVVMKGLRKTVSLYVLQGYMITGDVIVASSSMSDSDATRLWHMRLGHMSENGIVELNKRGLFDVQGITKLKFCEHCVFGKQKRVRFSAGRFEHFLKQKSDVFSTFKEWKFMIEKQTGRTEGIVRHHTVRHNPQQNGVIERMNRTLMEKEVWTGSLASYSDFKIFGCPPYGYVDNGKLEPRSVKCVFIGFKQEIDSEEEPTTYSEAVTCENTSMWMIAMQEEIESLHKNSTWDLVKLPKSKKVVRCKWVYKRKEGTMGVEKVSSIRALLGIVAFHDLELEKLDVKTAFLNGEREEDIYMQQLEGSVTLGKEDYVCELKKFLYGLKQSLR
ncbi:uncharacterized protein LOC124935518 [Impatiens glandulifera]|uniref:uncharacterized protein LOC124935518 n=1 Tax=Impatiens glandulifera TaxID=253017 RepID=UPI001FB055F8|nr:uncharacterized protein LOC124935518 [Impatiens glandulifera]